MRHLFIINPAAGKPETTWQLEEQLRGVHFPYETAYTRKSGDALRIARAAAETGDPVRIYACGGDGTLNEVVNGAAGFDNAAITCVPKGTGNDFLKLFGPDYRRLFYDLDCNGKLGLDVVCGGVDARIAAGVHRYKDLRFVSGRGAYLLSLAEHVLFRGICRPMEVRMGDVRYAGPTAIVCICNGRHYGGGFMPVADAMPDDGVLDMLLVGNVGLSTFLRLVGKYAKGRYRDYPDLIRDFHGQEITWRSDRELVTVVDGEVLRDTAFTVRLSERKVNFFYPAGASYAPEI